MLEMVTPYTITLPSVYDGNPGPRIIIRERNERYLLIAIDCAEIDLTCTPALSESILDILEGHTGHLILDLRTVEYLDSTGPGMLLNFHRLLRPRSVYLTNLRPNIARMLEILKLVKVFILMASVEAAEAAIAALPTTNELI